MLTLRAPKPPLKKAAPRTTRDRLLDAAAVVFAREGIGASTTREIAREAGVNEVTLFRLFQHKQNLLMAVIEREFAPLPSEGFESPERERDLGGIVRDYAASYVAGLPRNLALKRVLIGEIQRFEENDLKVIRGILEPTRQQLIGRLRAAQKAGLARKEMNPDIVADQINAILFMGALRNSLPLSRNYGARDYVHGCVETIVRGIEAREERDLKVGGEGRRK
jgi:AcrR family transcriptional regulator